MSHALYLVNPDGEGQERYRFLDHVTAENPHKALRSAFIEHFEKSPKIKLIDMKIKINNIRYENMLVAFKGKRELILAKKLEKQ